MLNWHSINWLGIGLSLSKLSLSLGWLTILLCLSKLSLELRLLLELLWHWVHLLHGRILLPLYRMELLLLSRIMWINHLNHFDSSVWWIIIDVVVSDNMVFLMVDNMMTPETIGRIT